MVSATFRLLLPASNDVQGRCPTGSNILEMVALAGFTTWLRAAEVLEVNEAFPWYSAVIDAVPAANFAVV